MLGVEAPDRTGGIRAAHPDLPADHRTDDVRTVAGRVMLKRDMGKLVFATIRDRDGDLQVVCTNDRRGCVRTISPRSTWATSSA